MFYPFSSSPPSQVQERERTPQEGSAREPRRRESPGAFGPAEARRRLDSTPASLDRPVTRPRGRGEPEPKPEPLPRTR